MILGLSHIVGETRQALKQVEFWKSFGLISKFNWLLPVTEEKKTLLYNRNVRSVQLNYLVFPENQGPGIEFVSHQPQERSSCPADPGIVLVLSGKHPKEIMDVDGNRLLIHAAHPIVTSLIVRTPDIKAAGEILSLCGFQSVMLAPEEIRVVSRVVADVEQAWLLEQALFPSLAVRFIFVEDKGRSASPKEDTVGWNAFSFLCRDLDSVARVLPLCGYQKFDAQDGSGRELAFYNGSGLLIEFLKITKGQMI